jgi:hypothetical protein
MVRVVIFISIIPEISHIIDISHLIVETDGLGIWLFLNLVLVLFWWLFSCLLLYLNPQ